MIEAIIAALAAVIVGGLSLVGVIITNKHHATELDHKLEIRQAVTDEQIKELTREVRKHNNFAERMPRLEEKVEQIEKKLSDEGH